MATKDQTQAPAAESAEAKQPHGGILVARRLKAHGVSKLFTLSGGHLFSIYDGCRDEGVDIIDVRHESAAAFAAEGWAKVTREPGVAALTAGPGVTNGMSALASAHKNNSPMLVLGGRAPQFRWGQGSLQEIDHVPFVAPLTKSARTATSTAEVPKLVDEALAATLDVPTGPAFLDLPLDVVFMEADDPGDPATVPDPAALPAADGREIERVGALLGGAERPVIMAGTDLYWGHGEGALRELSEALGIPVFLNGLARGCLPADHANFYSRARSAALKDADIALVMGVPMDFRLGFGGSFGEHTQLVQIDSTNPGRVAPRELAGELYGGYPATLAALRQAALDAGGSPERTATWRKSLRDTEDSKRAAEREQLEDDRAPLHPMRIYKELDDVLDRDAIVIGDGGDYVSFAGRVMNTYEPGCWLDPGPFGCLGSGPGYAMAAKLARPDKQVCLLLGDGAFGFSGMEFDTMVRHGLPVVAVVGNNGIWALEKHPMEFLYGYSVAAELIPETRYDKVVEALGGHGEFVQRPEELRPALDRAFASGKPACVNVLTDPTVVYPRSANLA
jgi:acetolactate synthase I/II/III large subunit